MTFRVGLLDIGAAGVVLVALLLPAPAKRIGPLYVGREAGLGNQLALAQADLGSDPSDEALKRVVDLLVEAGQSDWALRIAGATWSQAATCDRSWPALMTSVVHLERLEIREAYEWAQKAQAACGEPGCSGCGTGWEERMAIFVIQLKAGIDSGIDPKVNPTRFREAVDRAVPMIRVGPRR